MRALPFGFGEEALFVANDWHSALVPVLLKDVYQARGEFKKSKVALCIHNIAFQVRRARLLIHMCCFRFNFQRCWYALPWAPYLPRPPKAALLRSASLGRTSTCYLL